MRGVFVTGTDTDVGKTIVSAALMIALRNALEVKYWKPIQTGIEAADDTRTVRDLAACSKEEIFRPGYRFERPVSPHLAARHAATRIEAKKTLSLIARYRNERFWIVEGAGGALVPLNDEILMCDLMLRLGLPVLIVARPTLGTINHTLLTIEALSRRYLNVLGVVINGGEDKDNREAIEHFGKVKVIAQIPRFRKPLAENLNRWAIQNQSCFNIF